MCKVIVYRGLIMVFRLIFVTTGIRGQLHEKYVGCFLDYDGHQRFESVLTNSDALTIEICIQKCYNESYRTNSEITFAALNNGRQCSCRNNFGQQLHDRSCNVKCSGSRIQNCGGSITGQFYSLYTVCPVGYFGPICNQPCHCKGHLPCNRKTGICQNGCDDQWTGRSCNMNQIIQEQYIGCYGDGPVTQRKHAMDVANPGGKTGSNNRNTNSNEFCIEICSNNNYTYAGMQYGYDCMCGEKYNKYGHRTHDGEQVNCGLRQFNCPSNGNQECGGRYANSVYYVCPKGFYGRDCIKRCHCSGGGWCRFNGTCLTSTNCACQPGWTGSACNTRNCRINNGDCGTGQKCEIIDLGFANLSMCRCKERSYRDNNTCKETSLHYVGCYKGNTTNYISVKHPTTDALTIEFCMRICKQLNKTYSLIQGGVTCLCGDDDFGQISPDGDCQVPCPGNKLQYCGGRNTEYVVHIEKSFMRQYIGCYKDNRTQAMEKKFSWTGAHSSIESCTKHCASLNYKYAGLQRSYYCFCGNSYDRYGPLPESSCYMKCDGDTSQICGGIWANSVYGVNDILYSCSNDRDCKSNETCNVIDLKYTNVFRCRCKQGFRRNSKWEHCTDVDECQAGASSCNTTSENCFNTVGSYRCECRDGFVKKSGTCEVNDVWCSRDSNCKENEACKVIDLKHANVSRCRCKEGFHRIYKWDLCTDVDECHVDRPSPCNSQSEYCINTIGSYICSCKDGFVTLSGKCEEFNNTPTVTALIILGIILVISLLISSIFVFFRIRNAKSIKSEQPGVRTKSDLRASCIEELYEQDVIYDDTLAPVDDDNVYELI